jgi:hypothetical protein
MVNNAEIKQVRQERNREGTDGKQMGKDEEWGDIPGWEEELFKVLKHSSKSTLCLALVEVRGTLGWRNTSLSGSFYLT